MPISLPSSTTGTGASTTTNTTTTAQSQQNETRPIPQGDGTGPITGYVYPGTDIIQTPHWSNQDVYGSTTEPRAAAQYRDLQGPWKNPVGRRIAGTDLVQTELASDGKLGAEKR